MSAASATPKIWRVLINPKLWDLDRFMMEWTPGTLIHQSKGALPMVNVPARGDTVVYVSSMAIVMRGTVISDGFQTGTSHQECPYNRVSASGTRPHAETPLYADIRIDDVYLDIPALQSGQATWARVDNKEHWSPVLASLATLTPPSLPVTAFNVAEVAPAPAPVPNVVEVADPIPIVIDDKDRRIAELERKVTLLTEAVTMFLVMKSATEHYAVTRAEAAIASIHTHGFPVAPVCLPTGPSFQLCGWGTASSTTTSMAEWADAMEELQTNTVKTDMLLTALTE